MSNIQPDPEDMCDENDLCLDLKGHEGPCEDPWTDEPMPPSGHGPESEAALRGDCVYQTLHGEMETIGGCACRWCDPMRYSRGFAGGGHWEHALATGYGHLCVEWDGALVTPDSDEWGEDPKRCRCGFWAEVTDG